jgi:hypothetical protein
MMQESSLIVSDDVDFMPATCHLLLSYFHFELVLPTCLPAVSSCGFRMAPHLKLGVSI